MRVVIGFLALLLSTATAFMPQSNRASRSHLFQNSATAMTAMPNPMSKLPWNVRRERIREARRLKHESAKLHRQLGIAEDSTYEQITMATDDLIRRSGGDIKKKIKIEMAKDQILQIRLNERLAGLTKVTAEARQQSTYEVEGAPEEDTKKKAVAEGEEDSGSKWLNGLIVKPTPKYRNRQITIWGGLTGIGVLLPPMVTNLGIATLLITVGQLIFRGTNPEQMESGFGPLQGGKVAGNHKKLAWLLGLGLWIFSKVFVFAMLPPVVRGFRWTPMLGFACENLILGVGCSFLQPYKGK